MKKPIYLCAMTMALSLAACVNAGNQTPSNAADMDKRQRSELTRLPAPADLDFAKQSGSVQQFELEGQTVRYRAFENIVYVLNPVDTRYQFMNIYIPEAYFQDESIDDFTAETAPIFLPNQVGGYMPATAGRPELDKRSGSPNAMMVALSKGYVVASAGARGRTESTGRAPAAIVDLKAAVRYLKANDKQMAGDANKIISNGTSAGGALSALLGTSGNAPEFEPYLQQLGAATADDTIFAVSAYCPIANLEHADMAYEWQFNGVNDYQKISIENVDYRIERKLINGVQTSEQIKLSDELKQAFIPYINSLNLYNKQGVKLTLDADGNGSFKRHIEGLLMQSAQEAINRGEDLSDQTWLTITNGRVVAADFAAYAKFVGRQKTTPAFDGIDLSTAENNLFGDQQVAKKHFTDFSMANSTVLGASKADSRTVYMMNPMNFQSKTKYYRIRHGENDRDTSLAISTLMALKLDKENKVVDFALPWGRGHSGDYDLQELFDWAKSISAP
ncbi:hypothetical protein SAMN02745664_1252 [Moraxella cuniculi DSM 21768]|uniref:BD-FAE-like domain-containing protein n=1 Tax=Moraxella cuniculi DSM 21768 TaxID=1122245 RepID=A0A1N7G800_9GAMM|nr:subtype B tannase [Moraxella cuniculi]SIS08727.1 hypothetical protein SAMN02745664_1252 [Moraxella cuniculi DSM 21768]